MHWLGLVACYRSLLSIITFPYCTAMLPIKFSWKLLPNTTSIWLFPPHSTRRKSSFPNMPICSPLGCLSNTPRIPLRCIFCPCCLLPIDTRVHNATINLGMMSPEKSRFPALHHPVWAQQSASCTSEFPWKEPSPLLLPPASQAGKQATNEAINRKSNDATPKSIHHG